ncbi:slc44a1, partial [Symbiodinium microadriaticum]
LNRCLYVKDKTNGTADAFASDYIDTNAISIPSSYSDGGDGNWSTGFFADLFQLRGYIFGFGIGIALFLSFFYLFFLRIPGVLFTMIWTVLIAIFLVLAVGSIMLYTLSQQWANNDDRKTSEVRTLQALSIIGFVLTGLYVCLLCVMRKRIVLALGIVKEASRALAAMPILVLMPVFQALAIVVFLVPWTIYAIYLASSGDIEVHETSDTPGDETQYKTMEYDQNTRLAFLYLLFCWFWTSEFILAVGQITSAMAISAWYFTRDKKSEGNGTVIWAFRTTCFYHLGTAAFGSLIIAIIKTIRAILAYLQKKAKKSGNQLALCVLRMLQCCMWCVEKCMRFLNKNAYIQTAIYGYSFCKACRSAFFLIARNVLRVIAVSYVGDFVLFLGKLFVPLLTTFLCYLALGYAIGGKNVNGLVGPLVVVFILSYFIVNIFVEVFGMAISTILICYCADEEMFPPEERFADGALRGAIKKTAQDAAIAKVSADG